VSHPRTEVVLCVNTGSSSVKCAIYDIRGDTATRAADSTVEETGPDALDHALEDLDVAHHRVTAVGHRIVHGGPHLDRPALIDPAVLANLQATVALAPLHQRAALTAIEALTRRYPQLPQVACFDTGFHRTMPEVSRRLALPRALADQGIRRYGFHGLSYEYLVATLGAESLGRAVLAHLGSGASLAAVRDGQSLDTTMGLTPTGGIVMGHRTGDLDPGVLVYLARELAYDAEHLERLVNSEGGLVGLAGDADLRTLLERRARNDGDATLAVEIYCTRIRMQIGAYAALLGGLDTLVFTGGVGAHAPAVRAAACAGLEHLGIAIDTRRNDTDAPIISVEGGAVTVRALETDENVMIARHVGALLATQAE
jgi:acetate kinase